MRFLGIDANPPRDEAVKANGIELCVETFGDRSASAILLIMGTRASMDWWEDEFCQRLAAGLRFVIRYDQRDTGRSVSYESGAPQYTLRDLAADAIGLLDRLGLRSPPRGVLAGRGYQPTRRARSSRTGSRRSHRWRERLGEVSAPTLVIHGTDDPVLPYGHGVALAQEIPGAELLSFDQTGHELPRAAWDVAIPAIFKHTARG